MPTVSLGDMAQQLMLRRHTAAANRDLASLTADLAKGTASDVHAHLGGNVSRLSAIEANLARNEAFQSSAERGATRAAAMQAALERVHSAANATATDLLTAAESGTSTTLATVATSARAALEDAISALNTRIEGFSLFSGTATDATPLPDADDLLAVAAAAVSPATAPADVAAALRSWLDDPSGFAAQAYEGTDDTRQIALGVGQSANLDITANDSALRDTFYGLLLGAMMAEPTYATDADAKQALAKLAGEALSTNSDDRVEVMARLGVAEERIAASQSRLSAESSVLQQARSDLIAVDGYDASTRLQESESRLELIYTLTARLSRLSLADYV